MSPLLTAIPGVLAGAAVLSMALLVGPLPSRLTALRARDRGSTAVGAPSLLARVGGPLRRRLGCEPHPPADRLVGLAVLVGLCLLLVMPPLSLVWAAGLVALSVLRRRRAGRQAAVALVDELPEVVDLLWLATAAGLTVPLAVGVVERHGSGCLARELGRARRRGELGSGLADALDEIPARLGESVRPVTRVLAGALRDGASITESLERVAGEVRTARRRAAEVRARRVSVRLLFPLVFCVLPAFALLTVVPLLAGALDGLAL